MTLPPRGHPDRIEEMRRRASLSLPLFTGDQGDCVPPPTVPPGSTRPRYYTNNGVHGDDLVNHPRLRYFGEVQSWWIVPEDAKYVWKKKKPPVSLPPRDKHEYPQNLGSRRFLGSSNSTGDS